MELTAEGLAFVAQETGLGLGLATAASAAGHRLARVGELRAVADPLRLFVLDTLMSDVDRVWSARELAERAGCAMNRMHYHLRLLEEQALVRSHWVEAGGRSELRYTARHEGIWFATGGGGLSSSSAG